MTPTKQSAVRRFLTKITASRPGAWFLARTLHHVDRFILKLSGGRTVLTSPVMGLPVVMVTTTGARSGLPRTWPLGRIDDPHDPEVFALIGTNFGQRRYPAWYFNLRANPRATCAFDGRAGPYTAREAAGEEYERFWQAAAAYYPGYLSYKARIHGRRIPIMVMTPAEG